MPTPAPPPEKEEVAVLLAIFSILALAGVAGLRRNTSLAGLEDPLP